MDITFPPKGNSCHRLSRRTGCLVEVSAGLYQILEYLSPADAVPLEGWQGRGVKLLHHFGDPLWALGDKSSPDSSFTLARVFPQVRRAPPEALPDPCCPTLLNPGAWDIATGVTSWLAAILQ